MYINKGILTFRTKTFCKFESSEMFLPRHTSKLLTSKTFKLVKFGWQTLKEISKFCIIWYPLKSFVLLLHQRNHYILKVFWSFTKFVSSQVNIKVGKKFESVTYLQLKIRIYSNWESWIQVECRGRCKFYIHSKVYQPNN